MKLLFSVVLALLAFAGCEKKDNPASDVNRYSIPNKPTNVRLVADWTDSTVYVTWQDNSDNENGFAVQLTLDILQDGGGHLIHRTQGNSPENATSSRGWYERHIEPFMGSMYLHPGVAAYNLSGDTTFVYATDTLVIR